jgi:hypothetical protein
LCGGGGVGFVHTTTVHQPSRAKRLFSIAGFGLKTMAHQKKLLRIRQSPKSKCSAPANGGLSFFCAELLLPRDFLSPDHPPIHPSEKF